MENRLMQMIAGVPQHMAQTVGVQPRHDPSQFEDPLSYGHMASRVENGDANARLGRAVVTGGVGAMAMGLPQALAAMNGMTAGQATLGTAVGGFPLSVAGQYSGKDQQQADQLRNLLMQRMQHGESLPPGLLDQWPQP